MFRASILLLFSIGLSIASLIAIPQYQQSTSTPAPSKTPGPSAETITTTESTEDRNSERENIAQSAFEPYTQADLTVLIGNVQRPNGLVWHNENLYTACNGDWTLYEIHGVTGSTRTYVRNIRNAHVLHAEAINGNNVDLWIPDYDTSTLFRVNSGGAPQSIVTDLQGPWGIAKVDEERFLISNLIGGTITLVSRSGDAVDVVSQLRSPAGIVVDEDVVYVANNGSARRSIEWFDLNALINGENPEPMPLATGLQNTTGMVLAADGYLYFAYALGTRGVVGRLDPEVCLENSGCSNDQIEIVLYTELAAPLAGLTISPDMRLYIHTIFRPEIYWLQLDNSGIVPDETQ